MSPQRVLCVLVLVIGLGGITPASTSMVAVANGSPGEASHRAASIVITARAATSQLRVMSAPSSGLTQTAPVVAVHATALAAAAAAPTAYRSMLISDDGTLRVPLGYYSDCRAASPLPRVAAIDTCVIGRTYFIGHNPGNFTPLLHMGAGSVITWWNTTGVAQRLRITQVHSRPAAYGAAPTAAPGVIAQFQTCRIADGSEDWVYDAVAA